MHKILHLHNFICSNVVDFKWSKIILMMQTKVKMSLMRNHMALSLLVFLGRSSIDRCLLRLLKIKREAFATTASSIHFKYEEDS